jgi:hypothetical protein
MMQENERFTGLNAVLMRCEWQPAIRQLLLTVECVPSGLEGRWMGVQKVFGEDDQGQTLAADACAARYRDLVETSWQELQQYLWKLRGVRIGRPVFSVAELQDVYAGKPFRYDRLSEAMSDA